MNRKSFILKTGAFIGVCACVGACVLPKGEQIMPKKEDKVDFTIDLTEAKFAELQKIGGFIYEKLIIIVRKSASEYLAFDQYCTHAAGIVRFVVQQNYLQCPVHGSLFDLDGKVIQSPAINPLKKYKIEQNGNLMRIFE